MGKSVERLLSDVKISSEGGFSEEDAASIKHTIAYVGIPPFKATLTDEQWIAAAKKTIEEEGIEKFLQETINILRENMASAFNELGVKL